MKEENRLARLNSLYHNQDWELFEEDIRTHLNECISKIIKDSTPTDVAERLRMEAHAYQSILDKVEVDKKSFIQKNK